MILQESLGDYMFQALVLGQPLFWMWLYDTKLVQIRETFRWSFYILSVTAWVLIYQSGFSVGFYTNSLLLQYTAMTMLAVQIFNTRYDIKKALALGFLTVFLNSYYWEIPLHLAEVLSGTLHVGMVVQFWRLIPIPFFLKHYRFTVRDRAILSVGLAFSMVIMFAVIFVGVGKYKLMLYSVNRFISLCLLLKVLIEAPRKETNNIDDSNNVRVIG